MFVAQHASWERAGIVSGRRPCSRYRGGRALVGARGTIGASYRLSGAIVLNFLPPVRGGVRIQLVDAGNSRGSGGLGRRIEFILNSEVEVGFM